MSLIITKMSIFDIFKKKEKVYVAIEWTLSNESLTEHQKTADTYGMTDPLEITLTESKIPNIWYHHQINNLFRLTAKGFELIPKGHKSNLISENLIRL
jgi:hypothetical protein